MLFYKSNNRECEGMSIRTVVTNARRNTPSPMPRLEYCNDTEYVRQGEIGTINMCSNKKNLITTHLISCASVVFASIGSGDPALGVVYHAPMGVFKNGVIQEVLKRLGHPTLNNILVIYAIRNPRDENYISEAQKLINLGIPEANVVFIENIVLSAFGINSHGQVGARNFLT